MMIKFTKQLFTLLLVVCFTFFYPGIRVASANNSFSVPQVILTASKETTKDTITIFGGDLTPQERQKLQAVRQRRNKEVLAVLDSEQQKQFAQNLHDGSDFNTAIEAVELSPEQRDLINSIIDFTNLKLKGIFYEHELLR